MNQMSKNIHKTTQPALLLIGLMAGLMFVSELLSGVARWVRTAQSELLQDHISSLIHETSVGVDLELFDPTDFNDRLHLWAKRGWQKHSHHACVPEDGRFRELARGRTAIIITHRFTTAMQADVSHVMDSGRLIESGSHDEFVPRRSLYAASWHTQMQHKKAGTRFEP